MAAHALFPPAIFPPRLFAPVLFPDGQSEGVPLAPVQPGGGIFVNRLFGNPMFPHRLFPKAIVAPSDFVFERKSMLPGKVGSRTSVG